MMAEQQSRGRIDPWKDKESRDQKPNGRINLFLGPRVERQKAADGEDDEGNQQHWPGERWHFKRRDGGGASQQNANESAEYGEVPEQSRDQNSSGKNQESTAQPAEKPKRNRDRSLGGKP